MNFKKNDIFVLILSLAILTLLSISIYLPWYTYQFNFQAQRSASNHDTDPSGLRDEPEIVNVTIYGEEFLHGLSVQRTIQFNGSDWRIRVDNESTGANTDSSHSFRQWKEIKSYSPAVASLYKAIYISIVVAIAMESFLILVILLITSTQLLSQRFRLTVAFFRNKLKRFVIFYGVLILGLMIFSLCWMMRHPFCFKNDWSQSDISVFMDLEFNITNTNNTSLNKENLNQHTLIGGAECAMEVCSTFYDRGSHLGPANGWKLVIIAAFLKTALLGVLTYMVCIVKRREMRRWRRLYTTYGTSSSSQLDT